MLLPERSQARLYLVETEHAIFELVRQAAEQRRDAAVLDRRA